MQVNRIVFQGLVGIADLSTDIEVDTLWSRCGVTWHFGLTSKQLGGLGEKKVSTDADSDAPRQVQRRSGAERPNWSAQLRFRLPGRAGPLLPASDSEWPGAGPNGATPACPPSKF